MHYHSQRCTEYRILIASHTLILRIHDTSDIRINLNTSHPNELLDLQRTDGVAGPGRDDLQTGPVCIDLRRAVMRRRKPGVWACRIDHHPAPAISTNGEVKERASQTARPRCPHTRGRTSTFGPRHLRPSCPSRPRAHPSLCGARTPSRACDGTQTSAGACTAGFVCRPSSPAEGVTWRDVDVPGMPSQIEAGGVREKKPTRMNGYFLCTRAGERPVRHHCKQR
jgi:hypothetical protein